MNKKFISALLFGAMAIASTSTFVSCKDYDDDIDELHALVDQNSAALTAAKSALEAEIATLKTQMETKDAELASLIQAANAATAENKDAIAKEILRATQAEAALEARIVTAEKAIADIQTVLAGKVDKSEFDSTVKDIYAKLETVTTGLGKAMESIEALKKGLADEETARKAVAADLAQQVAALEALTKRVAAIEGDYLKAADKKALEDKIEEVRKALNAEIVALSQKVDANTTSIDELKTLAQKLSTMVDGISAELNTLNVLVKSALRSIVFIPEAYYFGIEATSVKYLAYEIYTLSAANVDKKLSGNHEGKYAAGEVNDISLSTKVHNKLTDHVKHATSKAGFEILDFTAQYHLNPSNADLKDAKFTILSGDKQYIDTRAGAAAGLSYKSHGVDNGILTVNINIANPNAIKSVKANSQVTVFATQIELPGNGEGEKVDTTITSDYATLYADHIKDIVIAHKKSTVSNPVPTTGVKNTHCGDCNVTSSINHLFATAAEAAFDFEAQDTCDFNSTLDLRKLVEAHYTETDGKTHKVLDISTYGFSYKFELVGLWYGTNETSESAHAAINPEDGYTFRPQGVITSAEGKHQAEYGAIQHRSTIGRTPLVRVSLVNKNGEIVDYGYIRIRISETVIPESEKPEKFVYYQGAPYKYDLMFNTDCMVKFNDWSFEQRWDQMENDVYLQVADLGLSKDEFHANYELELDANGTYQQYDGTVKETVDGKPSVATFKALQLAQYRGNIFEKINTGSAETNVIRWDIAGGNFSKTNSVVAKDVFWSQFNPWTNANDTTESGKFDVAVKYVSKNQYKYPNIFVWIETGDVNLLFKKPYGKTLWANNKIKEYWWKVGSTTHDELTEIRTNTFSPEDERVTNLDKQPFFNNFSNVFVQNTVVSNNVVKLLAPYTANTYFNKSSWNLVFSDSNNGKEFKGITDKQEIKTYVLKVGTTSDVNGTDATYGKGLWAAIKGTTTYQKIADLIYNPSAAVQDANSTQIQYFKDYNNSGKDAFAKALLNYKSHLAISNPDECKDVLNIIIGLDGQLCETDITMFDNEFNVRFLRPINVEDNLAEVTDAATDTKQIINCRELVKLSDWRSTAENPVWKNENIDYWNYYQIKNITIAGASATASADISDVVYTNLNRGYDAQIDPSNTNHRLSKVSNKVRLYYTPGISDNVCDYDEANPGNYGYLTYENLGSTVDKFKILIPLKVEYEWGYVFCNVTLTVNRTVGNAKPHK